MDISLPEGLRDFAYEQFTTGYEKVGEYIRELIRTDQLKRQKDALERAGNPRAFE